MIRSRLRRPTSKSMTAVLKPRRARPEAKLALVVVFPTPPLPDVTTTILVMEIPSVSGVSEWFDDQAVADATDLGRLARDVGGQRCLDGAVDARDRHQLRIEAGAEDPGVDVAARAGHRAAAQRRVDV